MVEPDQPNLKQSPAQPRRDRGASRLSFAHLSYMRNWWRLNYSGKRDAKPLSPVAVKAPHKRNGHRVRDIQKGAIEIAFGASEFLRSWLHDAEMFNAAMRLTRGYQPTYFKKEGIWLTSLGYYRLWEGKIRDRLLLFAHAQDMLDIVETRDLTRTDTGGKKFVLKRYLDQNSDISEDPIYPAKFFPPRPLPRLTDILQAMSEHSKITLEAILHHLVLHHADQRKGVFRAGAGAFQLVFKPVPEGEPEPPVEKRMVTGILYFPKVYADDRMVNPWANPFDRTLHKLISGRDILTDAREKGVKIPSEMSYAQAREYLGHYWDEIVLRYVRNQSIISWKDWLRHPVYYSIKYGSILAAAMIYRGRYYFRRFTLETAVPLRNFLQQVGNGLFKAAALALDHRLLAVFIATTTITALGLLKRNLNPYLLIDTKDKLVKTYSEARRRIASLLAVQRRIKPYALDDGTIVMKPTFDRAPPDGLKMEESLEQYPADRLQTACGWRLGSRADYFFEEVIERIAPAAFMRAVSNSRQDGLVRFVFPSENFAMQWDTGKCTCKTAMRPPQSLLDYYKPGHVILFDNDPDHTGDAKDRISYVPKTMADRFVRDKFGRSMFAPDLATPDLTPAELTPEESQKGLAAFEKLGKLFKETAVQISDPSDEVRIPANLNRARKLVTKTVRERTLEEGLSFGAFRPFVEKMAEALMQLEATDLKYDPGFKYGLHVVGEGKDRSMQLSISLAGQDNITVMTRGRYAALEGDTGVYFTDYSVVENGVKETPVKSSKDAIDFVERKLKEWEQLNRPLPPLNRWKKALNPARYLRAG